MCYPLNTDFRYALRTLMAFEDTELTLLEKYSIALRNMLIHQVPDNCAEAAIAAVVDFMNGSAEHSPEDRAQDFRLYSVSKDAEYIFAAFRQTHGIDLSTAHMHWWKFLALFMDLGANTVFCQLVALRKRVKSGRATKEEREAAQEMGSIFEVAELDMRTSKERVAESVFMRLLGPAGGAA